MAVDNRKKVFYGWWLVAIALFMQSIGVGTSLYLYSVIAGALEQAYPSGRLIIMMGVTGLLLIMALMSPKVGELLDRFPVKRIVIAGALIMGCGFILVAVSTSIWQVIVCYGLFIAVGMATLSPLASSTLLSRWFIRHRGLALGIAGLGTQFGGLIYPPIIAHFIEAVNWRFAVGGLGVFILLTMPLIAYLFIVDFPEKKGLHPDGGTRPADVAESKKADAAAPKVKLLNLFRQPTFLFLVIAIGGATAVQTTIIANLTLFAIDIGEPMEKGAYLVSMLSMLGMISSPLAGRLCDVWNVRLVSAAMLSLSAVATLVFIGANSYSLLLVAAVFQGAAGGSIIPIWALLVGRIYGTLIYGQVMGATTLVVFGMTATAPILAGWLHDTAGSYRILFLIMFAVMLVVTLCIFLLHIPKTTDDKSKVLEMMGN